MTQDCIQCVHYMGEMWTFTVPMGEGVVQLTLGRDELRANVDHLDQCMNRGDSANADEVVERWTAFGKQPGSTEMWWNDEQGAPPRLQIYRDARFSIILPNAIGVKLVDAMRDAFHAGQHAARPNRQGRPTEGRTGM
jgi:hypothetical protein